jgi:hypothetical protein
MGTNEIIKIMSIKAARDIEEQFIGKRDQIGHDAIESGSYQQGDVVEVTKSSLVGSCGRLV